MARIRWQLKMAAGLLSEWLSAVEWIPPLTNTSRVRRVAQMSGCRRNLRCDVTRACDGPAVALRGNDQKVQLRAGSSDRRPCDLVLPDGCSREGRAEVQ